MTPEQESIEIGIHHWAKKAIEHDWVNQKSWFFRLERWWNWKIYGLYIGWYDEDELASSIIGHTQNDSSI